MDQLKQAIDDLEWQKTTGIQLQLPENQNKEVLSQLCEGFFSNRNLNFKNVR
jgi:hypothetical protein